MPRVDVRNVTSGVRATTLVTFCPRKAGAGGIHPLSFTSVAVIQKRVICADLMDLDDGEDHVPRSNRRNSCALEEMLGRRRSGDRRTHFCTVQIGQHETILQCS